MRYLNGKVSISTWGGLSKAKLKAVTAGAKDVLKGKVIIDANGNPLTGVIESGDGQTITPTSAEQTVSCSGNYMTGDIKINGDSNLVAANIVSGKSIFGVAGNARKYGYNHGYVSTSGSGSFRYAGDNGNATHYRVNMNPGYTPVAFSAVYQPSCQVTAYVLQNNVPCYMVAGLRDYFATWGGVAAFGASSIVAPVRSSGTQNVHLAGYY